MYVREKYSFFDELPLTMDVKDLSQAMNIGKQSAYRLLRSKDFPSFKFANKYLVNKDSFIEWIRNQERNK